MRKVLEFNGLPFPPTNDHYDERYTPGEARQLKLLEKVKVVSAEGREGWIQFVGFAGTPFVLWRGTLADEKSNWFEFKIAD